MSFLAQNTNSKNNTPNSQINTSNFKNNTSKFFQTTKVHSFQPQTKVLPEPLTPDHRLETSLRRETVVGSLYSSAELYRVREGRDPNALEKTAEIKTTSELKSKKDS